MKKISTIFLQIMTKLLGLGVLAFMLWEPHLEGGNADASVFEVYFKDPFLAYVYLSSIPFFVALYHVFKLLGNIRRNEIFSEASVKSVRTIKRCALYLIGLIALAEIWIIVSQYGKDDIAGGVAMGLFMIVISAVVAATASVFEGILKR